MTIKISEASLVTLGPSPSIRSTGMQPGVKYGLNPTY